MTSSSQNNYDPRFANNQTQRAQQINQIRQNYLNNQYVNDRNYPTGGYPEKTNTYLPIRQPLQQNQLPPPPNNYQQYPPQYAGQYPQQVPFSQDSQRAAQFNQYNQPNQPYYQPQPISNVPPPVNYGPNVIPPSSPLFRHKLSQINEMITKNLSQFSPQFQKQYKSNQSFKSFNDKFVYIPSFLIIGHVLLNRNKKWFKLTANPRLIRYSILGLLVIHLSTRVLYTGAYRQLLTTNRQKIQNMIVRQEFLSGGDRQAQ